MWSGAVSHLLIVIASNAQHTATFLICSPPKVLSCCKTAQKIFVFSSGSSEITFVKISFTRVRLQAVPSINPVTKRS